VDDGSGLIHRSTNLTTRNGSKNRTDCGGDGVPFAFTYRITKQTTCNSTTNSTILLIGSLASCRQNN